MSWERLLVKMELLSPRTDKFKLWFGLKHVYNMKSNDIYEVADHLTALILLHLFVVVAV